MSFALSRRSKEYRAGVDSRLIAISDLAIKLTHVDFGHGPYSGLRTASQQYKLYKDAKSKCDGKNTRSKHQDGMALDFYAFVNGKASWEERHLTAVATAFYEAAMRLGYRIRWGGFFGRTGWDKPHVELIE